MKKRLHKKRGHSMLQTVSDNQLSSSLSVNPGDNFDSALHTQNVYMTIVVKHGGEVVPHMGFNTLAATHLILPAIDNVRYVIPEDALKSNVLSGNLTVRAEKKDNSAQLTGTEFRDQYTFIAKNKNDILFMEYDKELKPPTFYLARHITKAPITINTSAKR
jgi:hypothetical protein